MAMHLTLGMIRAGASSSSFERGQAYYREGMIFEQQVHGNELCGRCVGNSMPDYKIRVFFDENGVKNTHCTCEYDYGGYCKHVVALMLAYIHSPQLFVEKPTLLETLKDFSLDDVKSLLIEIIYTHDLYNELDTIIAKRKVEFAQAEAVANPHAEVDVRPYQQRIQRSLPQFSGNNGSNRRRSYDDYYDSEDWIYQLEAVIDNTATTIGEFIDAGNLNNAITLALAVVETLNTPDFQEFGELDSYHIIDKLLAKCVLMCEPDMLLWKKINTYFKKISTFNLTRKALENGWQNLKDARNSQSLERSDHRAEQLIDIQLEILDEQSRIDDFLILAHANARHKEYTQCLMALGRYQAAIDYAKKYFTQSSEAADLARQLHQQQHIVEAVALAEHGLRLAGDKRNLASWLAPLEESLNRTEQAIRAWVVLYNESPKFEHYLKIQSLAGDKWPEIKPALIKQAKSVFTRGVAADILLYEGNWDEAIGLINDDSELGLKVVDGVMMHRTEWVIDYGKKMVGKLLKVADTTNYPIAVYWMQRIKSAYAKLGKTEIWVLYLAQIKEEYRRRPSFQAQLKSL